MKIIGITGGVGSGKSRILSYLETNYDACVYQADEVAKILQNPGEICYQNIVSCFGEGILHKDAAINRAALADMVFSDKVALEKLNQIVHPEVKAYLLRNIKKEQEKNRAFFFIEAALLIEDKYDKICDELWYIYVDTDTRKERLREQRGYSAEKMNAIFANQLSESQFYKQCHKTIDNSGSFAHTKEQIRTYMAEMGALELEK